MGTTSRSAVTHVALDPLSFKVRRYAFYQLVELLHRHHGDVLEQQGDQSPLFQRVSYKATASLGFPSSDVLALDVDEAGRYTMEVSFLGLQGAQSPLPGYYLENLAYGAAHKEGAASDFLDFFNHRLLTLMHRGWRKYRHYIRYQDNAQDGFSAALFALVGLADSNLRGETPLNWSKMLPYAGLLAGRSRSAEVLSGIVSHCFDLPEVEIDQWVHRWVDIPREQLSRMGLSCMTLGQDMVAGKRVADVQGRFLLRLKGLSLARFSDFLPERKDHHSLTTLVNFVMREPLAYDLELELMQNQVKASQLGDITSCQLGWTTFIDPDANDAALNSRVRIQIAS